MSGLGAAALLSWAWIAPMAVDMYGAMSGLSAWMMTSHWDARHLLLLWLMWAVMMAAMMLPSAMPLLMLYDSVLRRRQGAGHVAPLVYAMAGGYLLAWAAFSVAATALQRGLSLLLVVNPMMEMTSRGAIGATLLLAAAYQFTPAKNRCLRQCRSPLAFVMRRWRRGVAGAVGMGAEHGLYCVGCCWALMLLLFAGGVMNLTVIVGLTAVVLVEKLAPSAAHVTRILGAVMAAAGLWLVLA